MCVLSADAFAESARVVSMFRLFIQCKLKGGYPHQVRLWLEASDKPVILIDDATERTKLLV